MPSKHTDPPGRVPPGFDKDPLVHALWGAYWRELAADGADCHHPDPQQVAAFWKEFLPEALRDPDALADMMHEEVRGGWTGEHSRRAAAEIATVARIERSWGEALDLLDQLIAASQALLAEVHRRIRDIAPEVDWTRRALVLVYARGIQTAGEIRTLLRAGFAAGAWARWRTLHELSVVALFIGRHGDAVAEAYLAHDEVQALRTIKAHEKSSQNPEAWGRLRQEQEKRVASLRGRFGKEMFKRDYGWAAPAFPPEHYPYPKPGIEELEEHVRLGHARGVCMAANHVVHAGPRGFLDNPGHAKWPPETLLTGPSPYGIDQAAGWTAESLGSLAAALVRDDMLPVEGISIRVIAKLKREVLDAFLAARHGPGREAVQEIVTPDHLLDPDGAAP